MKAKVKKSFYWSVFITSIVLGVYFLLGGQSALAAGPHGHGPGGMGQRGNIGGQHFMNGPHHVGGFTWLGFLLFLMIGIVILILLVRWLKRKAKASSMHQFIDTSMISSHKPIMKNQNESFLDHWEKNLTNKREHS